MDDLISRQAAITALTFAKETGSMKCGELKGVIEVLNRLPSVQKEIIYCGECTKMKVDSIFHDCWCSETGKKVWINHYCGYAERREVTT